MTQDISRLGIIQKPSEFLYKPATEEISHITSHVREVARYLQALMKENHGVGIAANQVGHAYRMVVVDIGLLRGDPIAGPMVMVNPELKKSSNDMIEAEEGCLSVPEGKYLVKRSKSATVRFLRLDGKYVTVAFNGYEARVVQHELDHLNGVLIDRIGKLSTMNQEVNDAE